MWDRGGSEACEDADLSGVRILVVEDEFLLADLIGETLTETGAEIMGPVGRLDDALALISAGSPDVAVLDVNLRGESVHPLAAALAARKVPFLFLSGYRNLNALQAHFPDAPTLEKPADLGALRKTVSMLLGARACL